MLLLTTTSDKLRLVTSSAADIHVHASWVDYSAGTITPGSTLTAITSATTTDIVPVPGASTQRNVKSLICRNKHASTSNDVTLVFSNGTAYELFKCTLGAGETLVFNDGTGFQVFDSAGALRTTTLGAPIGTSVYNTAAQSITTATWTILIFDTEVVDFDDSHSTVSNTGRLTARTTGWRQVQGHASFASSPTGQRYLGISKNAGPGSGFISLDRRATIAADQMHMATSTIEYMVAGDFLTLQVYHDVGSNLNVDRTADYTAKFIWK